MDEFSSDECSQSSLSPTIFFVSTIQGFESLSARSCCLYKISTSTLACIRSSIGDDVTFKFEEEEALKSEYY